MYTRTQLAELCKVSKKTIRVLLEKFGIQPGRIEKNKRNLPVYYYSEQNLSALKNYVVSKEKGYRKCCICKERFPQHQMQGNRCITCYVKKYLQPIIYGKQCWNKVVNSQAVQIAIQVLRTVIPNAM